MTNRPTDESLTPPKEFYAEKFIEYDDRLHKICNSYLAGELGYGELGYVLFSPIFRAEAYKGIDNDNQQNFYQETHLIIPDRKATTERDVLLAKKTYEMAMYLFEDPDKLGDYLDYLLKRSPIDSEDAELDPPEYYFKSSGRMHAAYLGVSDLSDDYGIPMPDKKDVRLAKEQLEKFKLLENKGIPIL